MSVPPQTGDPEVDHVLADLRTDIDPGADRGLPASLEAAERAHHRLQERLTTPHDPSPGA